MAEGRVPQLPRFFAKHRHAIAYGLVLVVAAALRYTGLNFLPRVPWGRPDEEIFVRIGLGLFSDPNPHVGEGGWPEGWFRVHHWVQRGLRAWWALTHDGADTSLGCVYAIAPWRLVLPVRVLSATLGVLTVALTMRLGWLASPRSFAPHQRHVIAWLSGLFYAVDVLAMRDAHFAVSDAGLMFCLVWMLVATARGLERGALVDFLSAGIALGLAIGTKWTGLPFAVVPFAALLFRWRRYGPTPSNFAALLLGLGGAFGAFVLVNPTFLSTPELFIEGVRSHAMRYDPNAPRSFSIYAEAPIQLGLIRHPTVSLPFSFGWPLTLVAAIGTFYAATRWRRAFGLMTPLLGLWTLFFLAVVGRATMYFGRYALPLHPSACVSAALVIVVASAALVRWWEARRKASALQGDALVRRSMQVALGVGMLLAAEPTFRSIETDAVLLVPETRERAMTWLHQHAGDTPIDYNGDYARPYAVDPEVAAACEALLPDDLEGWVPRLQIEGDSSRYATSVPGAWAPLVNEVITEARSRRPPRITAEWALVARPWLPCDQPTNPFFSYAPPRCYREVARFEPEGIECDSVWDDQDHFYMPMWGFTRPWTPSRPEATRWGSSIVIYHSECPGPR